jgi:type II secretory pathway pseudopilin PulG
MSYTPSPDDTQPRRPVEPPWRDLNSPVTASDAVSRYRGMVDPPGESRGRGCLLALGVFAILGVVGVAVVLLSALAGWTSGQRQASVNATATQSAAIQQQLARIGDDVASGNTVLVEERLRFLATLTPGVPGVPELAMTATALVSGRATPTPEPLPLTPTNAPLTPNATATPGVNASDGSSTTPGATTTPAAGGLAFDLNALMTEAQNLIATSQWEEALATLDVIAAADSTFQASLVRQLTTQALTAYAMQLYNARQPAAANIIATRLESYAALPGDIAYERMAAQMYLNARAAAGVNFPVAIQALRGLMDLGAGGRYYAEAQQLLYEQYVAYGDAFTFENRWCEAAQQYQRATQVLSSGVANGKYSAANTNCLSVPTVDPLAPQSTLPPGFVPLGQ